MLLQIITLFYIVSSIVISSTTKPLKKDCLELQTRPIIPYGFWLTDHESEGRSVVWTLVFT